MLRRLFLFLWYATAGLVIGLALLISLVRLSLPLMDSYRHQLEDWIEEQTGQPVSVGRLDVGWYRLGPKVRLLDARLLDPAGRQPVLKVRELSIGLELWPLLSERLPVVSGLVVSGAEVSLVRLRDGRVVLKGFEDRPRGSGRSPLAVILAQPRIEFEDIDIRLEDQTGVFPQWRFQRLDAVLLNRGDRHQFNGEVTLPEFLGRSMEVGADLWGRSDALPDWHGRIYLAGKGLALRTWLKPLKPHSLRFGGLLDTRVWIDFGGGGLRRVSAEVAVELPEISHTRETLPLFAAAHFDGQVEWRARPDGWSLDVGRVHLAWVDRAWPENRLSLVFRRVPEGRNRLSVGLRHFEPEPFRRLVARLAPLDEKQRIALAGMAPRGALRDLRLVLERGGVAPGGLAFAAAFEDIGVSPWERLPGITGLSGRVQGTLDGGELVLDSRPLRIDLPRAFRNPLSLDRLQGTIRWRRLEGGVRLETGDLRAANADIATLSRLRMDIPAGGSPFLDMQTAFREGDLGAVGRYLPARIMNPVAVDWLERALVSGDITSGGFLFHGRLADFPFAGGEGRMEVRVNVSNAVLDYHPAWHRIEEIEAEVAFVNERMLIRAADARILGTRLEDVEVGIRDLRHSLLDIEGRVRGPFADMLRFVRESPLARRGYPVDTLAGRGEATLDLRIALPFRRMHRPDSLRVGGRLYLDGNGLVLKDWGLDFQDLHGEVAITEGGIATEDLRARLLDTPVRLDIGEVEAGGGRLLRASLSGRLPLVEELKRQPLGLWQRLSGAADWRLAVDVVPRTAAQPTRIDLRLESDLRGIAAELPPPFGKQPEEARPFVLRTRLERGHAGPLYIGYGPHSAALLLRKEAG